LYLVEENISSECRTWQLEYRRLLAAKGGGADVPIQLRQIYLPEMNRVDRCVTCHLAIDDPRFNDEANPLKAHPGDYLDTHDPDVFGCTVCHDGQGRATNWNDAAAVTDGTYWPKPLLKAPFIEANCYRCHAEPLAQTPTYNRGADLFTTNACLTCHAIDGKGGRMAQDLAGIADADFHLKHPSTQLRDELLPQFNNNRNLAFLYEAVRFPAAQPPDLAMVDYGFTHEDSIALTVYLKSLGATPATGPRPPLSTGRF
jgi:cytochrome c553